MAIASFEEFSKGFCEIAGIAPPLLEPDEHGVLAFTVCMRGIPVTAMQVRSRPDAVHVMVELGALPQEHSLQSWRAMLHANMFLLDRNQPTFSRNPGNGEGMLHQALILWDLNDTEAFEKVSALVDMAAFWHEHHLLPATAGDPVDDNGMEDLVHEVEALDQEFGDLSCKGFDQLYEGVCRVLNKPVGPLSRDATSSRFELDMGNAVVNVFQARGRADDCALVTMSLGGPQSPDEPAAIAQCMEANFRWMTMRDSPVASCNPLTGDLFIQYAYPLSDAHADVFVARAAGLALAVPHWRTVAAPEGPMS